VDTPNLFSDDAPSPIVTAGPDAPLAERMRPRTLDEVVGQQAVLAPGAPLRQAIEADVLQSLIRPAQARPPSPG
jgi:putative ATPase